MLSSLQSDSILFPVFTPHHVPPFFLGQLRCNSLILLITPFLRRNSCSIHRSLDSRFSYVHGTQQRKKIKPEDLHETNVPIQPGSKADALLAIRDLCTGLDETYSAPVLAFFFLAPSISSSLLWSFPLTWHMPDTYLCKSPSVYISLQLLHNSVLCSTVFLVLTPTPTN